MKPKFFIMITLAIAFFASCEKQKTYTDFIDFEDINLGTEGYWNGSDGSGGFAAGNAFFYNDYNDNWQSWSGFSVSNHTDNLTPGYQNQYSSIAGSGADGSAQYAVLYSYLSDSIEFDIPQKVTNIALCNSTYAYFNMLNGDQFSEKFGGPDGSESDYFELIISGVNETGVVAGTYTITLASFNNAGFPDFIGNAWTDVDLSPLGFIKKLVFSFDSSRKNEFGILTPTYICIDNIKGVLQD